MKRTFFYETQRQVMLIILLLLGAALFGIAQFPNPSFMKMLKNDPPKYKYVYEGSIDGPKATYPSFISGAFKHSGDSFYSTIGLRSEYTPVPYYFIVQDSVRYTSPDLQKKLFYYQPLQEPNLAEGFLIPQINDAAEIFLNRLRVHHFESNLSLSPIKRYSFYDCFLDNIQFQNDSLQALDIKASYISRLQVHAVVIKTFGGMAEIDTIDFSGCTFLDYPTIQLYKKPKLLILSHCKFKSLDGTLSLADIWNTTDEKKCLLNIYGTDLGKLKIKYSEFTIDTSGLSFEQIQSLYTNLKDQYTKLGMIESLQLADIDLIRISNFNKGFFYKIIDWINYHWWKYGYDKGKVITNSLFLFLLFLIINFLFGLKRLVTYAYSLSAYKDILSYIRLRNPVFKRFWLQFWYTFLFTCLVFWGINLEKKELQYKNLGFVFYILLQYLVGVLCLAYVAAFILSK